MEDTEAFPKAEVGSLVFVNDEAQPACTAGAWRYIETQRVGYVKQILDPQTEFPNRQLAVEFPEEFIGGHMCQMACSPGRGQYIPEKFVAVVKNETGQAEPGPNEAC